MRILIVTTDFLPNVSGIATLSFEHARGLASLGHTVRVVTTTPGGHNSTDADAFEVLVRTNDSPAIIRLKGLISIVSDAVNTWNPDIIWCTNYRGFGLPVWVIANRKGIPFGIYLHGTELLTEHRNRLRRIAFGKVVSAAALACTNSKNTARILEELYGLHGTPVTPGVHAIPLEKRHSIKEAGRQLREHWLALKPLKVSKTNRIISVAACRICKAKGIGTVLNSLAQLDNGIRNRLLFVAIGSGAELAGFQQMADRLRISNHVLFTGPMDHAKIQAAYAAADFYLQPSQPDGLFLESFGISFLEAQAAGLPCIGSNWGGIPEAIQAGITGTLVPPASPDSVAEAIVKAATDTEWRATASASAVKWAAENTWRRHCEHLAELMNGIEIKPSPTRTRSASN